MQILNTSHVGSKKSETPRCIGTSQIVEPNIGHPPGVSRLGGSHMGDFDMADRCLPAKSAWIQMLDNLPYRSFCLRLLNHGLLIPRFWPGSV